MTRFAYVCKFCIYAKFAYVRKSGHVYVFTHVYKFARMQKLENLHLHFLLRSSENFRQVRKIQPNLVQKDSDNLTERFSQNLIQKSSDHYEVQKGSDQIQTLQNISDSESFRIYV